MSITLVSALSIILFCGVLYIFAIKTKMYSLASQMLMWFLPIPTYFIFFDVVFCDIGKFAKTFPIPVFVFRGATFIVTAYFTVFEFKLLQKYQKTYQKDTSRLLRYEPIFVAVKMTVCIIVFFAMLNLLIFSIFPNHYTIDKTLSDYELAFEFLYYSFNVTITYSNSGIEATGVIAKLLQMTHIAVFYFYAAGAISKLIKGTKKESN